MGHWGLPREKAVCGGVGRAFRQCGLCCGLCTCFCANLYQLWIFIDMLFLCLGALQGRNTILSLDPRFPIPNQNSKSPGACWEGLVPSLRIPQSCDSGPTAPVVRLRCWLLRCPRGDFLVA